jgi:hypothetical protein
MRLYPRLTLTIVQNLLSLFMRPLRLFVATEDLRRARIVVLRITHSPFVAAIFVYEYLSDKIGMGRRGRLSKSSLGGPATTSKAQNRRSLIYSPRHAVAASISQVSLDGVGTFAASRTARPLSGHQEDLRTLVMKLSSQVEQLTQIVTARDSNQGTEGD